MIIDEEWEFAKTDRNWCKNCNQLEKKHCYKCEPYSNYQTLILALSIYAAERFAFAFAFALSLNVLLILYKISFNFSMPLLDTYFVRQPEFDIKNVMTPCTCTAIHRWRAPLRNVFTRHVPATIRAQLEGKHSDSGNLKKKYFQCQSL